jgi:type IX secretion system PorP/SprF family membrane protein
MVKYLRIRLKQLICVLFGLFFSIHLNAQDPLFSQYYAQALHINPGFAGISHAPRFESVYRNQWPSVDRPYAGYVTYSLSYDQYFNKSNSGLGIQLIGDDAGNGFLKTWKLAGTYGYQMKINKRNYLRGGIELGYVKSSYAWEKFIFGDQLDPEFGAISPGGTPYPSGEIRPDQTDAGYLDISTGILYFNPVFNIGISAKHINTPQNDILKINSTSYSGIPIRWVVHGGLQLNLSNRPRDISVLSPAIMIATQSEFFQLNVGAQYQFSTVFAGMWYRHTRKNPDALIGQIGFKKGVWKFGYSYDFTISELGINQGGSHEISIGIYLDAIIKEKLDIQDCFQAFR